MNEYLDKVKDLWKDHKLYVIAGVVAVVALLVFLG